MERTLEWLGVILLFGFGVTMIIQGHFIFHGKRGYRHCERENEKMDNARKQVEQLFREK
jgi:putative Mn2+ efflux pump MntP